MADCEQVIVYMLDYRGHWPAMAHLRHHVTDLDGRHRLRLRHGCQNRKLARPLVPSAQLTSRERLIVNLIENPALFIYRHRRGGGEQPCRPLVGHIQKTHYVIGSFIRMR